MSISRELLNKITSKLDIVEIVSSSGVTLTKKGANYVGLCPFHDDKNPSLTVSPDKQIYKCFSCGAGGDAIKYIKEKEINFIFWVPSVLVNIANLKLLDKIEVNALEKILFAGEVMPVKHLNYWRQKFKHALFANPVSYTHLRAHETVLDLVCRLLLEKKKNNS